MDPFSSGAKQTVRLSVQAPANVVCLQARGEMTQASHKYASVLVDY